MDFSLILLYRIIKNSARDSSEKYENRKRKSSFSEKSKKKLFVFKIARLAVGVLKRPAY